MIYLFPAERKCPEIINIFPFHRKQECPFLLCGESLSSPKTDNRHLLSVFEEFLKNQ